MRIIILSALVLGFILSLTGCSPQERSGLSPLPQNRPTSWETNPYGEMRN